MRDSVRKLIARLDVRVETLDCCEDDGNLSSVLDDWRSLSKNSEITCFQTVYWVQAWLQCFCPNVEVLRLSLGGELVGICLLVARKGRSKLGLSVNSLYFQQIGDVQLDQIWVEYNEVVSKKGFEDSVLEKVCQYLCEENSDWDELSLGTARLAYVKKLQSRLSLSSLIFSETFSYGVDIDALRESGVEYLDSLSRNTRYQIRRSIKLYQSEGEQIEVVRASSSEQAERFFIEAGEFHKKRWGSESGFYNENFIRFHKKLISNSFQAGFVDVLKVVCGGCELGYLYNMCCNGVVYFYLSGLSGEGNSKIKPGLTAHALAIEYYKERGMRFYDFMGGGGRYKESLGTAHESLVYAVLRKDKLKFRLENTLRILKAKIRERFLS